MRRLGLGLALLVAALTATPAQAIVGASEDGTAFAPAVVMVLNHVGHAAGFCSGLVVTQTVVLTAAHCVPAGAAVKVHYRDEAGRPVLLDVAATLSHPLYRADAIRTRQRSVDLALVRLAAPLPDRFRPAVLGDVRAAPAGTAFRLAGYGLTREGDPTGAGILRSAVVVARDPVSDLLLWARDPAGGGTGACTGDSGGPVFAEPDPRAVAVTVWSAGRRGAACGDLTQAVWLGPQRAWIEATLRDWDAGRLR